ncbi:MAG: TonB-dependent receptor, partial [Chitinophagaceae bacterium]|nr:TonB-dependent receptor [Chitinophagaceae bacterium]
SVVDNKFVVVRGLGERYNQAVLNGQLMPSTEINRKNFSFNMIPSSIIERITIVKTLTPDRSAEFGGALVDVKTIDIPTKDFFTISVGANYNDQTTGKDFYTLQLEGKEYLGQVSNHRKFLGKTDWRSNMDMSNAWTARKQTEGDPSSFLSNNWGISRFKAALAPNFQASYGKLIRQSDNQQWGITAALGYRNTLQSQDIKMGKNYISYVDSATGKYIGGRGYQSDLITNLNGLLGIAYKNAHNSLAYRTLYIRNYEQNLILTDSADHNNYGSNSFGYNDRANQNTIWQHQLTGEHLPGRKGLKINWIASYTELDIIKPDNHSLVFPGSNMLRTGPHWNDFNVMGTGLSSLSEGVLRTWSRAKEKNLYWDLSVSIPLKWKLGNLELNNILKAGYSGWHKDRFFYVLNMATKLEKGSNFLQPLSDNYTPTFGVNSFVSRFGDAFRSPNAQLHAGYLMFDNKLGKKWRLIWGLRGEYFDLNSQRNLLFAFLEKQNFDVTNLKSQEPNMRWFPSANIVYSLNKTMNLRVAYSKSIIRPDLREMSYLSEYDFELGGSYEVGNLRSTVIHHYDFRYEWYPLSGSVLTASVYYKKMEYPMEIYKELNNAYVLRNSKYAKNRGLEMELRQSLSPITRVPVLRNLTLYANMTWLTSKMRQKSDPTEIVNMPDGSRKVILLERVADKEISRPQAGASNWLINAGLYYDSKLISTSLLYNYMSSRAFVVAVMPFESIFERPPASLDAQVGVHLFQHKMKLTMNITNLLNKGLLQYMPSYLESQKEDASVTPGDLKYRDGNDIFFQGKPGRTYGFSISYNIR